MSALCFTMNHRHVALSRWNDYMRLKSLKQCTFVSLECVLSCSTELSSSSSILQLPSSEVFNIRQCYLIVCLLGKFTEAELWREYGGRFGLMATCQAFFSNSAVQRQRVPRGWKPTIAVRIPNPTKYYASETFAVFANVSMISTHVHSGDECPWCEPIQAILDLKSTTGICRHFLVWCEIAKEVCSWNLSIAYTLMSEVNSSC